jgi:taurine dioxygenase
MQVVPSPLTSQFGATVDVDVRTLSVSDHSMLVDLLWRHKLLVFPRQQLEKQDLVSFSNILGTCWSNDDPQLLAGNGENNSSEAGTRLITRVSNRDGGVLGDYEVRWHSDVGHKPFDTFGGTLPFRILFGKTVGADSAVTKWIDTTQLYGLVNMPGIDQMVGTYAAPYPTAWKGATRPLAVTDPRHPEQKALQFDMLFMTGVQGVSAEDFQSMRRHVAIAIEQCEVYTHQWQEGDLVLYNNYNTLHYRPKLHSITERTLWRTTFQVDELIPHELRPPSL